MIEDPHLLTRSPFLDEELGLLQRPRNATTKRIFVAATRMNDGKTTTCLGLFRALRTRSPKVGFIKPIGQRFIEIEGTKIDEDTFLLDQIFNVEVPIEAMSPVAVDGNFTRRYLKNPEANLPILVDRICRGFDRASYDKDFIIVEGTGHAGVGSVFNLSNAAVARLLGAKVVIVAAGGIGRPIDEIALNKALFDQFGVQCIGAILNKVLPEKLETVRSYAKAGLDRLGVPLLGCIPVMNELAAPNLSQIVKEVNGRWLNARDVGQNERVLKVVVGAMTAKGIVDYLQPGVLIITPGDREDIIFSAIAMAGIAGSKPVSGIILTRNMLPHPKIVEMLSQTSIPVVICGQESYAVASMINNMTVKTQPQDADKIPIIKQLILDYVDLDRIVGAFDHPESEAEAETETETETETAPAAAAPSSPSREIDEEALPSLEGGESPAEAPPPPPDEDY